MVGVFSEKFVIFFRQEILGLFLLLQIQLFLQLFFNIANLEERKPEPSMIIDFNFNKFCGFFE
jgi:hypothetical protein